VDLLGLDAKDLAGTAGNPGKQLGQIVGVQPLQRAPQAVIVEHLSSHAWSNRSFTYSSLPAMLSPPSLVGSTLPIFPKPVNQTAECRFYHKPMVLLYLIAYPVEEYASAAKIAVKTVASTMTTLTVKVLLTVLVQQRLWTGVVELIFPKGYIAKTCKLFVKVYRLPIIIQYTLQSISLLAKIPSCET